MYLVLRYSCMADVEDVGYYCLFLSHYFTVCCSLLHCFIQSYKFVYNLGEICVSSYLICFPFFAGIPTDWFSALPLHNLPYYRWDHTYVPCVLWKQWVFSIIVPGAVCFYFSSNWKTVHSYQTKNIWKTKSATHQTW